MDAEEVALRGLVSRIKNLSTPLTKPLQLQNIYIDQILAKIYNDKGVCVNKAHESCLEYGLKHHELKVFHDNFDTYDQKEGMAAFAEKIKLTGSMHEHNNLTKISKYDK